MAGNELIARWREVGEWWAGETPREVARFIDGKGVRREVVKLLTQNEIPSIEALEPEDHREDYDLRIRKRRDEKVARACGYLKDPELGIQAPDRPTAAMLHVVSGYSFGRSVMIAEEAPAHAAMHGYSAALIADRFSLAGAYEFARTALKIGVHPLFGTTIELDDGGELVLVAMNATGWRSLSRLVTECHLDEPRCFPLATWERLEAHTEGVLVLTGGDPGPLNRALAGRHQDHAAQILDRLIGIYGRENVYIQIERAWLPWEISVNHRLLELAETRGVVPVAGGPLTHLEPGVFPAQDVVVCVESLCLIDEIVGRKPHRAESQPDPVQPPRRALNAERHPRPLAEFRALYPKNPELVTNTLKIAERCDPKLLPGRIDLPKFSGDDIGMLREFTRLGAITRIRKYRPAYDRRIDHELERISRLGFSAHFLIAADMCRWARSKGILFSGRGSVVDSLVAFCLGLTRIDAMEHNLHFDRFLPDDASKRPDIDIDFEAARRNDVRGYLASKYGKEHVATVAAFGAYRSRGIIRDVGKVLGIPVETLKYLSKRLHGGVTPERLRSAIDDRPELRNSNIPVERLEWVFRLADQLMDVPTGIRSHSSGVIISRVPIRDVVPVMLSGDEAVPIIQWDKRSAKFCFDKFDVLCLRGNDVLSGFQHRRRRTKEDFNVEDVPLDDEETYRAMRSGALIGIPQSASPAMRQAHIRLRTENLTDASLVQAGIRPGVGGAVKINELIARRRGKDYTFNHPDLEGILGITYGLVVFQEQVDQLLQTFGKYSSDEAENTREAIHKRRREQYAMAIHEEVVSRIVANGYSHAVAEEVFELVGGFQGYGFAQGHALAFAEVSVRSIWCQQNHPAEYFAALLDAQPAGYYGPATIANEARVRGVKMLPPDVNVSGNKFGVEDFKSPEDPQFVFPSGAIRVRLDQIGGISKPLREKIQIIRENGPFTSFFDFVARVQPPRDELEQLILCGSLDGLWQNRREMLWAIPSAMEFAATMAARAGRLDLGWCEPKMPQGIADFSITEKAIYERAILDMDVDCHLMAFERSRVLSKGGLSSAEASALVPGTKGFVVGNPIRLRFPPTSSGKRVLFFDLEDETGLLNVTCFDDVYQRYGHRVICNPFITLWGEAQDRDGHTAFLAHRIFAYTPSLNTERHNSAPLPLATADFLVG